MPAGLSTKKPLDNISLDTMVSAFEHARNPMIITDYLLPDNPIVYSNQAFVDLTGYSMEEIIGRNCRFLQGEDTDPATIAALRDAIRAGEYVRVDIKNYTKNGRPFWNDLVSTPIKDGNGNITHFVGMQLDITDRVAAEARLHIKSSELEQSVRELEQFTYATSHDLQEPLRMVSSYLQLINKRYDNVLDDDAKTYLSYATEGAERMQGLIYDLLTLSKISTTTEKFKSIDLTKAVEQALFNVKLSIEETDAQIMVKELPTIQADPVQMAQLFQNLIGNAIKYRTKGVRPQITISAQQDGDDWVVSVADNGIGIDKQYHDRIFAVFQRLHTRSEYNGNGVGLAICARIIERHEGEIWVESTKGKGTVFMFRLPRKHKDVRNA